MAAGGPSTSLATIALSKVFPSSNMPCKAPALFAALAGAAGLGGRGLGAGFASTRQLFAGAGRGALPFSVAALTLLEMEPRISESAWMFFIL